MKNIVLLIFMLVVGFSGSAQLSSSPHHFGVHAGFSTGVGLSYRYWPNRLGLQITTLPVWQGSDINLFSGITALLSLKQNPTSEFFTYLGSGLIYESNQYTDFQSGQTITATDTQLNIGLGIGLRLTFLEVFDINFQGGYGIYDVTEDIRSRPTGEIGVYYRF